MPHIAVIGAGITGVTTCYSLLKRGYRVTVYDRNRYPAMATSFANGGQLSASNAEVWTRTATVLKGLRWMFRKDAPLLVNPRPDWHKLSWMAEFIASIPHYEANTIETVRLAIAAREHLFQWAREEDIDFNHEQRGILHIYADQAEYDHATRVNKLLAAGGLSRRSVTVPELQQIEPTIDGPLVGGYYTASDSTGDIHKYTRALADACSRYGAEFRCDTLVDEVRNTNAGVVVHSRAVRPTLHDAGDSSSETVVDHEHFDAVVICAGVDSRRLAAQVGDRVNVYPVKGYSITVHLDDAESQAAAPWVSLLDDQAKIVTSRLGVDRFRIAGTAEFNGLNRDIRNDRIEPLVNWCRRYFPSINTDRVVSWAGLRPMLPNMMPRVGAGRHRGIFYNTGHGHLGWTLSAATAEMTSDYVGASLPAERVSTASGYRRTG